MARKATVRSLEFPEMTVQVVGNTAGSMPSPVPPCTAAAGALATGFAANGGTPPRPPGPEPASLAFRGSALLGFGLVRCRHRG